MSRRRLVSPFLAAAALALAVTLAGGCGPGVPDDPVAALIADQSRTDEEVVASVAANIRQIMGPGGRDSLATVSTDAQGRPVVTVRLNPSISSAAESITFGAGEGEFTGADQRRSDIGRLEMPLMMGEFESLLRVGAARNLQQIEFVLVRRIGTDAGDQERELLRAVVPREKIEELAALPTEALDAVSTSIDEHWTVTFDAYDTLTFESLR